MRAQMRVLIVSEPGVRLCGEVDSFSDALDLFFKARPRLVLLDVSLPPLGGFEFVRTIRQVDSRCSIILLQNTLDPFVGQIGRLIGANDVCYKHGALQPIRDALRRLTHLPNNLHAALSP
jgi:DNA-binding NarL/FixJ family response regulator